MPRLGLTGDVMLGRNVDRTQRLRHGGRPPAAVWGDVLEDLRGLDGLLVNLECAISDRGEQWTETRRAFHFRAHPEWAITALDVAGVDCVTLANNHALDFGGDALADTLSHLESAGIGVVGAGWSVDEARAPATVTIGGDSGGDSEDKPRSDSAVEVAVVGFTDNTPEYAVRDDVSAGAGARTGLDRPGVAYLDMADEDEWDRAADAVNRARKTGADLVVASLHWGPNNVTEPAAKYRRFGRSLIDSGVDLIHGHSAHVFQGIERYGGGVICYDCGDFVDDYRVDPALRNDRSFLFDVVLDGDGTIDSIRLHPTEINDCAVHTVPESRAAWWHETMRERSRSFDTDDAYEVDGASLVLPV